MAEKQCNLLKNGGGKKTVGTLIPITIGTAQNSEVNYTPTTDGYFIATTSGSEGNIRFDSAGGWLMGERGVSAIYPAFEGVPVNIKVVYGSLASCQVNFFPLVNR